MSLNFITGTNAVIRSSFPSGRRFTIALPIAFRPASGISNTFSQWTMPLLVKNRMWLWVFATNRCSMKSPSLVDAAMTPLPPLCCCLYAWRGVLLM